MIDAASRTFFFLHVMKTAGTSFAAVIADAFEDDEIYPHPSTKGPVHAAQYWKIGELPVDDEARRRQIRIYHGHFPFVAASMVGADVTLTILRDPVERTISHLRHCERHFEQHRGKDLAAIYDDPWHHPLLFRNYQVKQFAMTAADRPKAHNEVIEVDDARLALAMANLEQVSVLGLTDRYDEFLGEVASRFGWRSPTRRLQVAPEVDPEDVSASLRARIVADNEADRAFYEHARSLYEQRRA